MRDAHQQTPQLEAPFFVFPQPRQKASQREGASAEVVSCFLPGLFEPASRKLAGSFEPRFVF